MSVGYLHMTADVPRATGRVSRACEMGEEGGGGSVEHLRLTAGTVTLSVPPRVRPNRSACSVLEPTWKGTQSRPSPTNDSWRPRSTSQTTRFLNALQSETPLCRVPDLRGPRAEIRSTGPRSC